jgi:uncharacterized protein YprB with RNaseH-like and TPR domain
MKNKLIYPVSRPRILLFDIETAPIIGYVWGLWDQNVGLNQIKSDWHVLSWAAKWKGETKIMYQDQRAISNIENDKALLGQIWKLLDAADVVVTQNGKKFDVKKLNARFIFHGFKPPAPFKHIDTLVMAKRYFGFTSNKLEYLANTLKTKTKKMSRREFDGFDLWKECLAGNKKAWREMERYNKADVLALEQVYEKMIPWDNSVNFNIFRDQIDQVCTCGSSHFQRRGFDYTTSGKYQRFQCVECGSWTRGKTNLLSKDKRASLKVGAK